MTHLDRRTFLKIAAATGTVLYLQPAAFAAGSTSAALGSISPIDRSLPNVAPREYFGDQFSRPHKILWNKSAVMADLASHPQSKHEKHPLVIVGGGISGLTTAYLLREHKPVILEQAPRFGGNAKGQSWRGMDYALGAAYIVAPEAESEIGKFLNELGLIRNAKLKQGDDPVAIGGQIFGNFWSGETLLRSDDPARAQFAALSQYFRKILAAEQEPYPDIPVTDLTQRTRINELDTLTFRKHVEQIAGTQLHPHIATAVEHYCWSSFGASADDISAAAGLNFYAAEFGDLSVFPGGNAAIAERLLQRLLKTVPRQNFRTQALVFDVEVGEDGVHVRYFDEHERPRSLLAKAVVLALPKFIVGKILQEIEAERLEAIQKLKYHAYLVANVLLKTAPPKSFYDLYVLGDGLLREQSIAAESARKGVTDVILGNFAHPDPKSTVLSLYRALPYDGGRAELFAPDSYEKFRSQFETQIREVILPMLRLSPKHIVDLRIARWGHPLPVASPRLIADGVVDKLRAPFRSRVFFVEQDNWALPAFETCVTEAFTWAPEIERVLNR